MSFIRHSTLDKPAKVAPTSCYRCGGAGGATQWPGWTCFRCGGSGTDPSYHDWAFPTSWSDTEITDFLDNLEAKNARARERRAEKKQAERDAALAANLAAYPELAPIYDRVRAEGGFDGFVDDVLYKGRHFPLSPAQVSAVVRAVAEIDAEALRVSAIPDLPTGLYTIVGRVISIKWVENQWGGQLKVLVELDTGQRVFGTLPAAISDANADDRISFDATVEASKDDRLFGFYKRPRNAQILERHDGRDPQ